MAGMGVGASLLSLGQNEQQDAIQGMGKVADEESQRNIKNQQLKQEAHQGNIQLGSTLGAAGGMYLGAQYGAIGGPMGAIIGGALGAVAGGLFH